MAIKNIMHAVTSMLMLLFMLPGIANATTASDSISISNPYARAVPPGQPNSAVFMQLTNTSKTSQAIVNATSNASKIVELHTHTHENGMMKMRRIEKIDIPATGNTILKPGGLHIMLIQLHKDLKPGQNISVTLEFQDGSKTTVQAPVRKIMMKGMMKNKSDMAH
ncbi:MAG: copper chaperone PCu(A)C [Gammaproteobacteria bacterium]|nr:copper chaperone PCu(A)C [Gammaproteobacteria bacterium]